jgi:hypothetical protein
MPNARFYSSIAAVTNLQVTANPSDTSIQVASSSGFPGSFPFTLSLDYGSANEELVDVTSGGPNIFTVTRAVDGTSASSHNAGAVVRHVSSARDFTDLQTHIAATSDVHGVTGDLVGTTMVQTLTNKTLTAPTINNPTVAGTVQGSFTFDDAITFTTGLTSNSSILVERALATDNAYRARVTGDTNSRFVVDADGDLSWGPGNATMDTNLYRAGANVLATDDALLVQSGITATRASSTLSTVASSVAGDAFVRFFTRADGRLAWGSGAGAADVSIERTGVGALTVNGNLTATNLTATDVTATDDFIGGDILLSGQNIQTYTPTVNGGGAVTWTTRTGWWWELGEMVFFTAYLVVNTAGTGGSIVQVNAPTDIYRGTRQVVGMSVENGGLNGHSHAVAFTGSVGATWDRLRSYDGQNIVGSDLLAGALITVQGWYRKV